MRYWLMKSEPDEFGIDDLMQRPKQTHYWDGVRNYQARNMIRDDMQIGDLAFFYHSNATPPGIAGIMRISSKPFPDPTQFDPKSHYYDAGSKQEAPRWMSVDVTFVKKFKNYLPLEQLRNTPALADMILLRRGNRLSITPITEAQWETILALTD